MENETNTTQLSGAKIIAFLIMVALIVGGIMWFVKQDDKDADKTWVASALKNYSTGTITKEDFDIVEEKSKSSKTRIIYRVTMKNPSKLLLNGTVYVGLIKTSPGSRSVDKSYVSTNLNELYETINR